MPPKRSGNKEAAGDPETGNEGEPAQETKDQTDTWGNGIGQTGWVEYEYDQDGDVTVIHLAHGDKEISERDENGEVVNRERIKDYAEEYPAEEWAFSSL